MSTGDTNANKNSLTLAVKLFEIKLQTKCEIQPNSLIKKN